MRTKVRTNRRAVPRLRAKRTLVVQHAVQAKLSQILGLRSDRIASAFVSGDGDAVFVQFGDGRKYTLAKQDITGVGRSRIASVNLAMNGAELVIRAGTKKILVPWDYVLYRCDLGYESSVVASRGTSDPEAIGKRIKQLREENGITVSKLAQLSGLARPNVHRLEAGRHQPHIETIAHIARALGVPLTAILRA